MSTSSFSLRTSFSALAGRLRAAAAASCLALLSACGGGADAPPPFEGGVAPTITQQPADLSVTTGQAASFTVAATGSAPLAYQWQRDGTDIAGATAATYSLADAAPGDSGAVFRAVVSNVAGSATSNGATLTVATSAPVLTITQQPSNVSVVAGSSAAFSVAATCSTGTLGIQWQRNSGSDGAFVAIDGATAASVNLTTTTSADSGAQFQAVLDCSGQSTTASQAATLTVTAPSSVTLDEFPIVGLHDQAIVGSNGNFAIDQEASGSFTLVVGNRIKRLGADLSSITLIAGSANNNIGSADGVGAAATFSSPAGLAHDAAGNVYVADTGNNTIRRIAPDGTVTTLAGQPGASGNTDGTGSAARFNGPRGMVVGVDGDLYVADELNARIRRVTTAGVVSTYAGSSLGYADAASALAAQFNAPRAVAMAANGDVLVADTANNRIRRILRSGSTAGAAQTLAGSGVSSVTDPTSPDGTGTAAGIASPGSLALRGTVLTVRDGVGLLRQIDLTTAAVTTLTGSHASDGYADGPPSAALLRSSSLFVVTTAANGGFLTCDSEIRLVSASGDVSTIASQFASSSSNSASTPDGTGVLAQLPLGRSLQNLAVDSSGRVIVGDAGLKLLRRIDGSGQVSLVTGLAASYQGMVDGVGSAGQFYQLRNAITQDSAGNLYVGDYAAVRKIAPDGTMSLLAGGRVGFPDDGVPKFGAVDGNAATARFNTIGGLAVGPDGAVYVGDFGNSAVRRIDAAGNVTTYAGVMGQSGTADGPIASARLRSPGSLAFAPDGSLYVSDSGQLRRISADGTTVSTINVGTSVSLQVFAGDGTMYFAASTGLWSLSPGVTTATLLIAGGTNDEVVLGSAPHLSAILGVAVLGPKQLLVISEFQVLKVSLP